jgi:hypothetical protein
MAVDHKARYRRYALIAAAAVAVLVASAWLFQSWRGSSHFRQRGAPAHRQGHARRAGPRRRRHGRMVAAVSPTLYAPRRPP